MRIPVYAISLNLILAIMIIMVFAKLSGAYSITTTNATTQTYASLLDSVETKKAKVGDIDIAYKIFGNGPPLLLIMGAGGGMDAWDPLVLGQLSANHTIIIFDNRGIGQTTVGNKNITISQYANDTAGLLDALQINEPFSVLGYSLGSFIAQELTLMHAGKVGKLVLFASHCGVREFIPGSPEAAEDFAKLANPNLVSNQSEILANLLFPEQWKKEHPNYLDYIPAMKKPITPQIVQIQGQAVATWQGSCERLGNITKPTLIIVGTEDNVAPAVNSMLLVEKIPDSWLVQIKGGGHGLIYQYPDKFAKILDTFLSTT